MKRNFIFILFCTILFSSCTYKKSTNDKIKIISTIFPIYDWVHNLSYTDNSVEDKISLSLLIKNGVDFHHYIPTDFDITSIKNSDLLIYTGTSSENWIKELIDANGIDESKVLNLSKTLQNTEINDDHIWLSLKNSKIFCEEISKRLIMLNQPQEDLYNKRKNDYINKLSMLDMRYEAEFNKLTKNTVIFCDSFPFSYFSTDYSLNIISLITECPGKNFPSEEKLHEFSKLLNEYDLNLVLVDEQSDKKYAKQIIMNSNHKFADIKVVDSLQTSTLRDAFNGKTYLRTMEMNLDYFLNAAK